jgi:hypothetical protein
MKRVGALALVALLASTTALGLQPPPGHVPQLPTAVDYAATLLPKRDDVVAWKTLGDVKPATREGRLIPVFGPMVLALNAKRVRVQGFMFPVETDPVQKHFVVTPVPPSCPFCMPAGPEAMVEVRLKNGIAYTAEPIIIDGVLHVRDDDPRGVFYSLVEAAVVKP